MANRNCLLVCSSDNDILIAVDMTSKHVTGIEFNHVEAIDEFWPQNGQPSKPWIQFDSDGGRLAQYLGDGQLGTPETDYAPAEVWESPPSLGNGPYGAQLGVQYRLMSGMSVELKNADSVWSGFIIRNASQQVVLDVTDTAYFPSIDSTGVTVQNPGDVGLRALNFGQGSIYYDPYQGIGLENVSVFYHNNQWGCIAQAPGDNLTSHYWYFDLTYDSGTNTFIPSNPTHLFMSTVWTDNWDLWSPYFTDDGRVILTDYNQRPVVVDLNAKTSSYDGGPGEIYNYKGIPSFRDEVKALAFDVVYSYYDLPSKMSESQASYEDLRANGLPILTVDRNLNVVIQNTNPLTNLPVLASTNWSTDSTARAIRGSSKSMTFFYNYMDDAGVRQLVNKLIVIDESVYSATVIDLSSIAKNTDCELIEVNLQAGVIASVQAYEVEGYVTHNGVPSETEVVLLDNTSRYVVGRTKSDPTTGHYYFRCWTDKPKSIFAMHPTTGALFLAAERIPVAVG